MTPTLWTLQFVLNKSDLPLFEEALMTHDATVSWTAENETAPVIQVTVILPLDEKDQNAVRVFVNNVLSYFEKMLPQATTITPLEHRDWLKENRQSFPPLGIGSFFIYGSHYEDDFPADKIPIKLDASLAFGSGEHATTKGCLLMIETFAKKHSFDQFLDMGCGSGILTIGALKLTHPKNWVAVDVDQDSVVMARQNFLDNGIESGINVREGDGYHALKPQERFDFIVSNILAQPLIQMAPQLENHLLPKGIAVLSGFLVTQKEDVIKAHEAVGLVPIQEDTQGEWSIVAFRKEV